MTPAATQGRRHRGSCSTPEYRRFARALPHRIPGSQRRGPTLQDHPRIAPDPARLAGKPVIRGTRLTVEFIVGLLAEGWGETDILANHPAITRDDMRAALQSGRIFPGAA